MAEEKKKRRVIKNSETVREKASKASVVKKPRRLHKTAGQVTRPLKAARAVGRKEFYLPMPDNRLGRWLNKRRKFIPRFFGNAWKELKQVTWPGNRETMKLTLAVFIFALSFGVLIALTDYGLDKLFKEVIIK